MAYKFYEITHSNINAEDYLVKVNGKTVELDTARVSACPFNRRWPGHQRGIEQSELVNFLSLETNEPLEFEIKPNKPFENVIIRPLSLGITPKVNDGVIRFTLEKNAYFTVEAYGRNNALHIFADKVSDYEELKNGQDVIYFGAGEHDVGQIELNSNQTLFIDEGAVVYACIKAKDAENIKIVGRGILDNSRNKAQILFEANEQNNTTAVNNAKRQHTVQIEYCTNVLIDGIIIRDSLVYNIRPIGCRNLEIKNVKIIGCWRYNSDGIDMHNCENVLIDNCFIRTFDDSICVKGFDNYTADDIEKAVYEAIHHNGEVYDCFKNVLVKNCVIWTDWGKSLEIGAETRAEEICDVVFENCDIIHVSSCPLDSYNVDYADVHNITYRDINVEYDDVIMAPTIQNSDDEEYVNKNVNYAPRLISVVTKPHFEYSKGSTRVGRSFDIKFQNIHLYGKYEPVFYFEGNDADHKTSNVTIENVYVNDELLKETKQEKFVLKDYTENIVYKADEYAQMNKNNVSAQNQLKASGPVRFKNLNGNGKKIMFVGNSITLHGVAEQIGWTLECGMAASAPENDYVHILMKNTEEICPDSQYCICQVASWEREYKNGSAKHIDFEKARDFEADVIVMRFIENCPGREFDEKLFKKSMGELLDYLNKTQKAKIIMTTGFWKHPGDNMIREYAADNNLPLVELGDLGESKEMKAIGLFEHSGVANHPGDLGMKNIAERIFAELKNML